MDCELPLPMHLSERLAAHAEVSGHSPAELLALAVAEKIARLEHRVWLQQQQSGASVAPEPENLMR